MKVSKISRTTNIICPNTGKRMMFTDFDSFGHVNDLYYVYVEHCPYCGQEHKFFYKDEE